MVFVASGLDMKSNTSYRYVGMIIITLVLFFTVVVGTKIHFEATLCQVIVVERLFSKHINLNIRTFP